MLRVVLAACFAVTAPSADAMAQRLAPAAFSATAPSDSSPRVSTTTARIVIGSAIGTAGFIVAFLSQGFEDGGHASVIVGLPLVASAFGAALPSSREADCSQGDRFLRGLVGSTIGTAAAVALAVASQNTRDAEAIAAVVTIMVAPAAGATLSMGRCRR